MIETTFEACVNQFLRPDGRVSKETTRLPMICHAEYLDMLTSGYHFEAEVLMTGDVSITISNIEDEDVDGCIVTNGPDVQTSMVEMLMNKKWSPA